MKHHAALLLQRAFARFFVGSGLLLMAWCAQAQWIKDEQAIMGTSIRVELWADDANAGRAAVDAVMAEMRRIDHLMSPFKADSELSRINQNAAQRPVPVSQELFDLIARSLKVSDLTHGAFDITFASVGHFYDYHRHLKPSDAEIRKFLPAINYHHVLLDRKTRSVRFSMPGVYLDLGGIAKGYAVDRCIDLLQKRGITHAIVTAGGDSRILGDRRGRPWMVGIRDPRSEQSVVAILPVSNSAVSTSGDYERYFISGGVRYHHILNPKTGKSATKMRSVTILAADATTTDALSTSVFVMGPRKGMQLVESLPGVEAVVITSDGRMLFSSGLTNVGHEKPKGEHKP